METDLNNTFETGTVLNEKWVILEFLGRGGMGEVYRAHQLNLNRDVAIKIISPKWLEDLQDNEYEADTCLERFRREVRIMAQIHHPNVLQVFDYDSCSVKQGEETISIDYIALEYIPGGTLRDTMSAEGFYPEENRTREWLDAYFLPLLDGIKALHDLGIVHRDLKPENVLMDDRTPKIADFGLARSCSVKPVTQSVDIKGTPPYMAPEQFMDLKRTDERTDVYALGKILYEGVSGKMSQDEIPFRTACLKNPSSPFFMGLDRIIQAATADDKAMRLPSVAALKQMLEEYLDKSKIAPYQPSSFPKVLKPGWNRKRIRTAVVVLAVLIVGLGLTFAFRKTEFPAPIASNQNLTLHATHERSPQGGEATQPSTSETTSLQKTLMGKDHAMLRLVPGGEISLPDDFGPKGGKTVRVNPFYMDETMVTNYQYVDFLNQVMPRLKVEDGVVKGDGKIWLLLGEVLPGYEPIMFQDGRFSVHGAEHSSCPVLRVTGYGAAAYALFNGRRLPTEEEWFYTVTKGRLSQGRFWGVSEAFAADMHDTMHQSMHSTVPGVSKSPSPSFEPGHVPEKPATKSVKSGSSVDKQPPSQPAITNPQGPSPVAGGGIPPPAAQMITPLAPSSNSTESAPGPEQTASPSAHMMHEGSFPMPFPVMLSQPDFFGIRGLNGDRGEWGLRGPTTSSKGKSRAEEYLVLGGIMGMKGGSDTMPSVVIRHPWEAFEEVGFRCVVSATAPKRPPDQ